MKSINNCWHIYVHAYIDGGQIFGGSRREEGDGVELNFH